MGLWYPKDSRFELISYSDAAHAGCKDDYKSTSGGLQFLGEKLMSWSSKNQDCTTMSTVEADTIDILGAVLARLSFMLDRKELTLTLDDFRTIFQLPQAIDNNHEHFVVAPKFLEMVPFYINDLGFRLELRSPSNFKTTGLHYSLKHPSTLIPYPRFTKLIVSHYMTAFPEISRRARDKYHNVEDDMMVKNIFNSGKHKDGVGMNVCCGV
ncbi:hypothetical protein Tco_0782032 [Tanacetum coccineum]